MQQIKYNGKIERAVVSADNDDELMNIAQKIELLMYRSAASFIEYRDNNTTKSRVYAIIQDQKVQMNRQRKLEAERFYEEGNIFHKGGYYYDAKLLYEKALAIFHRVYGEGAVNDHVAKQFLAIATVEYRLKNNTQAYEYCVKALECYQRLYGETGKNINMVNVLCLLGEIEENQGNKMQARFYQTRAANIIDSL